MKTLLVSILSVALLAGFASAALYTDDFNSYSDGEDLTGGVGALLWEGTDNGPIQKRVAIGEDAAARIGNACPVPLNN